MEQSPSQIFRPYRAIGLCSNHVPLVSRSQGPDTFVVTAVGNSFHVYLCDKLRLIFVGPLQPHPLQCLALQGKIVFASYKNSIKAFRRGQEVNHYHGHKGEIQILLPFGEHLVAIDDQNSLKIWHIITRELYGEIQFPSDSFLISCALHPSTYLNKLLLGSSQGELQLWNIRTSTLIYTFMGWGSKIVSLAQSQAVDVVGIGLENGNVLLHNLKFNETLMQFQQDWGPVTAISFRTDTIHTMATASLAGHVAIWDLDRHRLGTVLRHAHQGSVAGLQFINSHPILLTSGPDNTVKMWIFDQSDGSARLLRSRCGHNAPPTRIRFCSTGGDAVKILSGGLDNALRVFGLHKDVGMNSELSQGSLFKKSRARGITVEELKLPAIVDFASETTRARDWDGVVSCHAGHSSAQTWNLQNCRIGKHSLTSKHANQGVCPLCVTLSGCGHFAVIGMSGGHLEVFNMQSGLHRGEFGKPKAHSKGVRGVAVDALTMEVYSGSADSTVKFWSFPTKSLLHSLTLDSPVAFLNLHRDSSMLGVVCDNFTILIVDTDTKHIVRTFRGHTNRITDTTFSPDGRWFISSSMDCSIRTWDLPSGRLLDIFLVESPPTSIALSPSGDFLCSSHVDDLGIYLWANRTIYSHVSLRPLPVDHTPSLFKLPSTLLLIEEEANKKEDESSAEMTTVKMAESDSSGVIDRNRFTERVAPLSVGLVTLSSLPKSRWQNLQQLDIIKLRNKPKEPPKRPNQAPFFLPTTPGLQPKFVSVEEEVIPAIDGTSSSKILNLGKLLPLSEFQSTLQRCAREENYDPLMQVMKGLSPAVIDTEIRSLAPDNGGSLEWMEHFMQFMLSQLKTNQNFELVEAYIGLFLKLHSAVVTVNPSLFSLLEQLLEIHTQTWNQIQSELNTSACLLGYFKSATV